MSGVQYEPLQSMRSSLIQWGFTSNKLSIAWDAIRAMTAYRPTVALLGTPLVILASAVVTVSVEMTGHDLNAAYSLRLLSGRLFPWPADCAFTTPVNTSSILEYLVRSSLKERVPHMNLCTRWLSKVTFGRPRGGFCIGACVFTWRVDHLQCLAPSIRAVEATALHPGASSGFVGLHS